METDKDGQGDACDLGDDIGPLNASDNCATASLYFPVPSAAGKLTIHLPLSSHQRFKASARQVYFNSIFSRSFIFRLSILRDSAR